MSESHTRPLPRYTGGAWANPARGGRARRPPARKRSWRRWPAGQPGDSSPEAGSPRGCCAIRMTIS